MRRLPPPAPHGGPLRADDGPCDDFSASTNPYGPPEALVAAVHAADVALYPPLDDSTLRQRLAGGFATRSDRVVIGGGTAELIYRLSAALLTAGDRVLVGGPAFPEYARAARLHGAGARIVAVDPPGGPVTVGPLIRAARRLRPRLIWVAQPGNPTGRMLDADDLRSLARVAAATGALLVIDAAYRPMSTAPTAPLPRSAVVLHSVTKAWGIPGLRAGWLNAPPAVARHLRLAAPPWVVGRPEIAALHWIAGPDGAAFVETTRPRVLALAADLRGRLQQAGARPEPSETGFFVVPAPPGGAAAARPAGFALRPLADGRVRVAARTPEAHNRLAVWWASQSS